MQIVCLLVVLFAMLVMLGVPKDHQGPHGAAHRLTGSQKSQWCKRLPNNFHQNHQTLRHYHNKPHKCNQVFHSEYKYYITVIQKTNDSSNLWHHPKLFCFSLLVVKVFKASERFAVLDGGFFSFCTLCIFLEVVLWGNDLAAVLKALCCLRCNHSSDNMSFFLPRLVWSRLRGRGTRGQRAALFTAQLS